MHLSANQVPCSLHCTENSKHFFPEMKQRSLVPNFYIHVSESDLYIPMIVLGRPTMVNVYKSLTDTLMWKLGDRTLQFWFGNNEAAQIHFLE
jgi:hypothetical protein